VHYKIKKYQKLIIGELRTHNIRILSLIDNIILNYKIEDCE